MPDMKGDKALPEIPADATPADYLRSVKANLRMKKEREAFRILQQATARFPDDPVILSYFGCMQALVDKKYRSGVETCKRAITMLKKMKTFGEEMLYPVFYLNLGRACLAAQKRADAIDAFKQGLKYDNTHGELLKELRDMGIRKPAPVPFLDRSNPINKYLGLLTNTPAKGASTKR